MAGEGSEAGDGGDEEEVAVADWLIFTEMGGGGVVEVKTGDAAVAGKPEESEVGGVHDACQVDVEDV